MLNLVQTNLEAVEPLGRRRTLSTGGDTATISECNNGTLPSSSDIDREQNVSMDTGAQLATTVSFTDAAKKINVSNCVGNGSVIRNAILAHWNDLRQQYTIT